jgi:hypothetical protein
MLSRPWTTLGFKADPGMVSPASARDPANGQEYYIAQVILLPTEDAIAKLNGMKLVPGMPAEVSFRLRKERSLPI